MEQSVGNAATGEQYQTPLSDGIDNRENHLIVVVTDQVPMARSCILFIYSLGGCPWPPVKQALLSCWTEFEKGPPGGARGGAALGRSNMGRAGEEKEGISWGKE